MPFQNWNLYPPMQIQNTMYRPEITGPGQNQHYQNPQMLGYQNVNATSWQMYNYTGNWGYLQQGTSNWGHQQGTGVWQHHQQQQQKQQGVSNWGYEQQGPRDVQAQTYSHNYAATWGRIPNNVHQYPPSADNPRMRIGNLREFKHAEVTTPTQPLQRTMNSDKAESLSPSNNTDCALNKQQSDCSVSQFTSKIKDKTKCSLNVTSGMNSVLASEKEYSKTEAVDIEQHRKKSKGKDLTVSCPTKAAIRDAEPMSLMEKMQHFLPKNGGSHDRTNETGSHGDQIAKFSDSDNRSGGVVKVEASGNVDSDSAETVIFQRSQNQARAKSAKEDSDSAPTLIFGGEEDSDSEINQKLKEQNSNLVSQRNEESLFKNKNHSHNNKMFHKGDLRKKMVDAKLHEKKGKESFKFSKPKKARKSSVEKLQLKRYFSPKAAKLKKWKVHGYVDQCPGCSEDLPVDTSMTVNLLTGNVSVTCDSCSVRVVMKQVYLISK